MAVPQSGVPTAILIDRDEEDTLKVVIGVDPHKGSHTAVAVDNHETELSRMRVRASGAQAARAAGVGGAVRQAHLGGGGGRRLGLPAVPAAGGSR